VEFLITLATNLNLALAMTNYIILSLILLLRLCSQLDITLLQD